VFGLNDPLSPLLIGGLEQRTIFRDALHGVRRSGITPRSISQTRLHGHAREESARTIVVDDDQASSSLKDELHDAEVGLDRAKEEYRRLQREVCRLVFCSVYGLTDGRLSAG